MLSRYQSSKNHEWFQQLTVGCKINDLSIVIPILFPLFLCVWQFLKPKYSGFYQEHNKTRNCTSKACANKLKKYKILLREGEVKLKNKNFEIQKFKEDCLSNEKLELQVQELKESNLQKDFQIKSQLETIDKIRLENNKLHEKVMKSKGMDNLSSKTMSGDSKYCLAEKLENLIAQECDLDKDEHQSRIVVEENQALKDKIKTIQNNLCDSSRKYQDEIKLLTLTLQRTKSNLAKTSESNEKYIIEMAEMRSKEKYLISENNRLQETLKKQNDDFVAKETSNNSYHKIAKQESMKLENELQQKREEMFEKERKLVRLENCIEESSKEKNKLRFINEKYAVENEQLEKKVILLKEKNDTQLNQIFQLQSKNCAGKMKITELKEYVVSLEVRNKALTEANSRVSRSDYPQLLLRNNGLNRTRIMNNLMSLDTLSSIGNHLSFQKKSLTVVKSNTSNVPRDINNHNSYVMTSKEVDDQSNYMDSYEKKPSLVSTCNLLFHEPFATSTPLLNSFDSDALERRI